jgi:DNA modification methylase
VPDVRCHEDCAVAELDRQSGILKTGGLGVSGDKRSGDVTPFGGVRSPRSTAGDTGGASRFFYCAKASKRDRGPDNGHPTVKNTKLMEYLIRMITPPGGVVLDPFAGSGSTGVAARRLGFGFYGIEQDAEYFEIARRRVEKVDGNGS